MAIEGGKKLDYRKIEDNQLVLGFLYILYTIYIIYYLTDIGATKATKTHTKNHSIQRRKNRQGN